MIQVFAEDELEGRLSANLQEIERRINSLSDSELADLDESQFSDELAAEFEIAPLALFPDRIYVTEHESGIPADAFPQHIAWRLESSRTYKRQVITYHLPFSGDRDLFLARPSKQHLLWTTQVEITEQELTYSIINFNDDPEAMKKDADSTLRDLSTQASNVNAEVIAYNRDLKSLTRSRLEQRRRQLQKQSGFLKSLGVPIKRVQDVPHAFEVPIRGKRAAIRRAPQNSPARQSPEPVLAHATYMEILTICHQFGIEMERHPSIYCDKGEEPLRDLFLMMLSPHFEGTTSETFNKSGKTDILIRHEGRNVFAAECKIWRGPSKHSGTIDQILSYLTWRESKAAVLYFVLGPQIQGVVDSLQVLTAQHACFVGTQEHLDEGWLQTRFHLVGDPSRELDLAFIVFHFPPPLRT